MEDTQKLEELQKAADVAEKELNKLKQELVEAKKAKDSTKQKELTESIKNAGKTFDDAVKALKEQVAKAANSNTEGEGDGLSEQEKQLQKKGLDILKKHSGHSEVFLTADGFAFFKWHDAKEHSKKLSTQKILTVKA